MSLRDRDLISIQEARYAVERAHEAQKKFAAFSQQQVDAVVEACAVAAAIRLHHERIASHGRRRRRPSSRRPA